MNVIRTLPLLLLAAALSACAGKPARDSAPAQVDVPAQSPASAPLADSVPASTAGSADASAAAPVAATGQDDPIEDDFAALYGNDGTSGDQSSYDPWEPLNRKVHRFNVAIDTAIAKPVAKAYVRVVPRFARTGVSNFLSNLRSPVYIVNQLLQGRPDDAWDTMGRFLMNTTLGVGGLWDPASKAMVPNRKEDFGQTLGVWGWRQSRYVELPFFGPRTIRDVFGLAADMPLWPVRYIDEDRTRIPLEGLQLAHTRAQLLSVDDMRDSAVDEYALVRDAWLQRRNYQIENDMRDKRSRGKDDGQEPIPVDAVPLPTWGN